MLARAAIVVVRTSHVGQDTTKLVFATAGSIWSAWDLAVLPRSALLARFQASWSATWKQTGTLSWSRMRNDTLSNPWRTGQPSCLIENSR